MRRVPETPGAEAVCTASGRRTAQWQGRKQRVAASVASPGGPAPWLALSSSSQRAALLRERDVGLGVARRPPLRCPEGPSLHPAHQGSH